MSPDGLGSSDGVVVIVVALLGGGFFGFLGTLIKWRPADERATTVVQLADKAVVVQSTVIDDLNEQMQKMREQIAEQSRQIARLEVEVHDLSGSLDAAVRERDTLRQERDRLRIRLGIATT